MATVALGKSLIEEIDDKVQALYRSRTSAKHKERSAILCSPPAVEEIYNYCVPPELQKKLADIPKSYLRLTKTLTIQSFTYQTDQQDLNGDYHTYSVDTFAVTFARERVIDTSWDYYGFNPDKHDPKAFGALAPVMEVDRLMKEIHAIQLEQSGAQKKVKAFLAEMPSLNAAVKAWPGIVEFVPEQAVKRMSKPSPRVENKERARLAAEQFHADTAGDLARAKLLQNVADLAAP